MRSIRHLSILAFLFLFCGNDKSAGPNTPANSGRVTVNSEIEDFKVSGFDFSQGQIIIYPNSLNIVPDLLVLVQTNETGNVLGVYFSSIQMNTEFCLIDWHSNPDSAQNIFDNLSEVPDMTFQNIAIPVRQNQIWAVKTREENYAKILIIETIAYADTLETGVMTIYGEATFDWVYQPDGSSRF